MSVKGFKASAARFVAAAALVCGLIGLTVPGAHAATWMDPYLDQMVSWGIMRGDINGNLEPERNITRAEFVSMVNRAYGYTEVGPNPYQDVATTDWFYEDICIARNVGYFSGMSNTVAAPRSPLTREQAAMLIGKNMMLKEGTGETLGFNDSRQFSDWSRHMIDAVAKEGVISGYTDGSFRPQQNVTRGEVAVMLSKAIGTPIQEAGVHSLGGVYGNLTINTPGVTLKDTVVYGDLYVSGGIGLSNVELENVRVLGKIVVSGTGESEKGEHSVLLRNVTADELVLDSMANQFVTLKSEGFTNIGQVNVRTSAFLEDVTDNGYGLNGMTLDGDFGTNFHLAGNIKDVLNVTPGSTVTLAQGVTQSITIDEKAIGSQLNINNKAMAGTVNLDTAVKVEGTGDITHMNVNAAGSSSVMLPDTITVRPGITADVYEEEMDSVAAQESSAFPRLLSGYPAAENISPKATDLVFKTNKKGTIYWAVTALSDGTVEEDELMNPPTYGGTILKSGTITATASNTAFTAKVSGLTTDGSYYVSAMLVDNRGMRSPVKITAFTTPDDTTPAFASGYPTVTIADGNDGEQIVQALVMPNKNCRMYYALLPKGSTAPKPADFKANAVTGNLGYGIVDVQKNTPYLVSKVNTVHLEEVTDYDLYLWLTDVDGAKSSAVKKVTVKTLDRTPPKLQHLTVKDITATSVSLNFAVDEPATLYWAVVKDGAQFYMAEINNNPDSEAAKIQIENGINALKKGSSNASKGSTDVKFTISGLTAQTAYDLYYVVKDKAGNYGVYDFDSIDMPYPIYTLDNQPPTVYQEFTHDGSDGMTLTPYPDTAIRLVFSENVQGILDRDDDGESDYEEFLKLYQKMKDKQITADEMADVLRDYIKLYSKETMKLVTDRNDSNDGMKNDDPTVADSTEEKAENWVIDYRKARIEMDKSGTGELIITFPYNEDSEKSALNLSGGATYYFTLEGIADTSTAANRMAGKNGVTTLKEFTVISAQILLSEAYDTPPANLVADAEFDMTFLAQPVSHKSMDDNVLWDMVVWSDTSISFNLYQKVWDEAKNEWGTWEPVNASIPAGIGNTDGRTLGCSIGNQLLGSEFGKINELTNRMYGIKLTSINGQYNRNNFNTPITVRVTMVTGDKSKLKELGNKLANSFLYADAVESNPSVSDITAPLVFTMTHTFMDNTPPNFIDEYPTLVPGSSRVKFSVMLDRMNSYYYYVVAPVGHLSTTLSDKTSVTTTNWETVKTKIPESGKGIGDQNTLTTVSSPDPNTVMTLKAATGSSIKSGNGTFVNGLETVTVTGLLPNTDYLVYFVLKGESQTAFSPQAYIFRFNTGDVDTPTIFLMDESPSVDVTTSTDAVGDWILVSSSDINGIPVLNTPFYSYVGLNANNKDEITNLDSDTDIDDNDVLTHLISKWTTIIDTTKLSDINSDNKVDYQDIRVIDALSTDLGKNDKRSLFDYYAGQNVYDRLLATITSTTGAGSAYTTDHGKLPKDGTQTYANQMELISPNGMFVNTQYYFIAAARNVMGTLYGFKAIPNIHVVDATPPEVSFITTSITPYDASGQKITGSGSGSSSGTGSGGGSNNNSSVISYYEGTVTIMFTKTPYRSYWDNNVQKTEALTKDILSERTVISGLELTKDTNNKPDITFSGQMIQYHFKTTNNRSTIALFSEGFICDASGKNKGKTLLLTLDTPSLFVEGSPTPEFTYEWK